MNQLFEFDVNFLNNSGYSEIVGIDEVGRGSGAGPVYACAYSFFANFKKYLSPEELIILNQLNDSKKIPPNKRETLSILLQKCGKYSVASISNKKIDKINILEATLLAMRNAANTFQTKNAIFFVDGNRVMKDFNFPQINIIKGDSKSASIAAASIIAKVARDNYMIELSKKFNKYAWDKNKGYLTYEHVQAIKNYGVSKHHRISFLKNILPNL